ncbi:transposase family protein [Halosquirtibacter laminarini]|uniref:Transposase family protein n=1 Tax=Halosquirtibacter laminarini TaxID=3374600 RepID=A0AC61NP53_9BACT|nr:transposase family protein [Prolixibacteraceae bacterium]
MKENLVDPRDSRGKKHDLEFVLVGVTLSIITGNTLLSEISRFLENYHSILLRIVGVPKCKPISYSQLRRIISYLTLTNYQEVQSNYFGWENTKDDDDWISLDGKELRGTIISDRIYNEKKNFKIRPDRYYELSYWDDKWITISKIDKVDSTGVLKFENVPLGGFYWVHSPQEGKGWERPFIYKDGKQLFY